MGNYRVHRKTRVSVRGALNSVPACCSAGAWTPVSGPRPSTRSTGPRWWRASSGRKGDEDLVLDHYLEVLASSRARPAATPLARARAAG